MGCAIFLKFIVVELDHEAHVIDRRKSRTSLLELAFFKSSNPNFLSRFGTPFLLFLFFIPLRDLIVVGEATSKSSSASPVVVPSPPPPTASSPAPVIAQHAPVATVSDGTRKTVATPYAKKLAKQHRVDIRSVAGTGPFGRITASDVEAALPLGGVRGGNEDKTTSKSSSASPVVVPSPPPPTASSPAPVIAQHAPVATLSDGMRKTVATPYAKKLAKQHRVDIKSVAGTGPFGRITASDVEAAVGIAPSVAAPPPPPWRHHRLLPLLLLLRKLPQQAQARLLCCLVQVLFPSRQCNLTYPKT
ncbi:hypothetical protein F2Q69_00054566 [Brassica cretica]|uniref:Peripheral subunit-binding (PSBD) domain-containing protein n=1 Tax=Brassica cretica TaxID=69181 RepID=A0A8S9N5N0_BRACR|nr:hypothetical protein F2Q69_00054566 [Brassica cretica]